jgi:hypothetical protein
MIISKVLANRFKSVEAEQIKPYAFFPSQVPPQPNEAKTYGLCRILLR